MACDLAALQESERAPPKFRFVRCAGRSEVGSQKVCHPAARVQYLDSSAARSSASVGLAAAPTPLFLHPCVSPSLILSSDGAC